jgi:hypothetical protein
LPDHVVDEVLAGGRQDEPTQPVGQDEKDSEEMSFRRGQMISWNALRRLAPVTLGFFDIAGDGGECELRLVR